MYKLGFLALVTIVAANDLIVGQKDDGQKIFDEKREASPAIWRQTANVTISLNDTGVISKVVITDLRPEKDGEAKIVEGGEGHKNVTIELKSPTVFRGYDFHIVVYAVPDDNQQVTQEQSNVDFTKDVPRVPVSLSGDTLEDNLRKTRKTGNDQSTTLTNLDLTTTTAPFQVPRNLGTLKPEDGNVGNDGLIQTPNTGKDVQKTVDVSATAKAIIPEVTPTTVVTTLAQESEVTHDVQKNTAAVELRPVQEVKPSDDVPHTQLRNVRKSEVPSVADNSAATTKKNEETVTISSTEDASTPSTVSDEVTDTLALDIQKDLTVPKVIISDEYQQKHPQIEVRLPYKQ